jgi:hypothetical protein
MASVGAAFEPALSVSHCGRYTLRRAAFADAQTVLTDLSHEEADEGKRLGIVEYSSTYQEVATGRSFAVTTAERPFKTLVIFGVNTAGGIWLLPSQHCVEKHGRMLANKRICQWFLEYAFSLIPEAPYLFNYVTPEGKRIINWLEKSAGARFAADPVPSTRNGAIALPFIIENSRHV